jgi:S-adenosylmethionine-diacylglycerol 3-amino-3-carboxypropyl transferase
MTEMPDIAHQRGAAVYQKPRISVSGLQERLFARLFAGLVYAQIWEDPASDMQALGGLAGADVICISSGGCNAMSYLTAGTASVTAVDLSPAHIALLRLKKTAAQVLDPREFYDLFGHGDRAGNPQLVAQKLLPHLDAQTRRYWANPKHRQMFAKGLYRQGVLGRFIGAVHVLARLARVDFAPLLDAPTLAAQRDFYDRQIDPLFDNRLVKLLGRQRMALFGLGIPPAQYDKLAADGGGDVIAVLRDRTRRLMCDFPARENYFLWQACARRYDTAPDASLPPYLQPHHFDTIARQSDHLRAELRDMTSYLSQRDQGSYDAYVLLDAQDWMNDAQLAALWAQITRTARPDARVLFRTGGAADILPGRVPPALLNQWRYDPAASARAFAQDRSAIYGGVHLYRFAGAA